MLKTLVSLLIFVAVSNGALRQFGLQYYGQCVASNNNNQHVCNGKAESQTLISYIDPATGVDFSISTEPIGPTSTIYIKILRNQNGQGYLANGNVTYGGPPYNNALFFNYNNYDEVFVNDPENTDYFTSAAYINVTSGSGVYNGGFGLMTFVSYDDRGDGAWNPYVFTNLVIPGN